MALISPRDAEEDLEALGEVRIGDDQRAQRHVDGRELALDLAQPLRGLPAEQGRPSRLDAVPRCDAILDQSAAGDLQLFHLVENPARRRACGRLEQRAEASEHRRVDDVRLGVLAERLREAPRPAGFTFASGRPASPSRRSKAWW